QSFPEGSSYYLQVSNDSGFGSLAISISTPMVIQSTSALTGYGAYLSTFTLADATTYYWRIGTTASDYASVQWQFTLSFVTDFSKPAPSGSFSNTSPTGSSLSETQINTLAAGVTAQIGVQDPTSGLAISTNILAYAGDAGHDDPVFTGAYGVMYTTS